MTAFIRAEGMGKRYGLVRAGDPGWRKRGTELWALRDIDLVVREGETVGVIGPNGAGKSTLFKLISRVTRPTRGRLEVGGRVSALIELGAGFHPELSGRENIFLCGSILGMTKKEIAARFDEIVAFSELDDFIEAPVKRYSSGMYLRLGFSVAAHLSPDILLMDEVLSVGDLAFQAKCIDWMYSFANAGRIFFLASHQMHHVERLCRRAVYLDKGRVIFDGPVERAISLYLGDLGAKENRRGRRAPEPRLQAGPLAITSISILDEAGEPLEAVAADAPLRIRIGYDAPLPVPRPKVEIAFNGGGRRVGQANTAGGGAMSATLAGKGLIEFHWPRCLLAPNHYTLDVYISDGRTMADLCVWKGCLGFRVLAPPGFRLGSGEPGFFRIPGDWTFG